MSKTTVVNIRTCGPDGYDVYIGRGNHRYNLPPSQWMNPYPIQGKLTRSDVIDMYRVYLAASPTLMAAIGDLRGKRLACWCAPEACHGDVLAELANALTPAIDQRRQPATEV